MIYRHRVLTACAAACFLLCGAGGAIAQPSPALAALKQAGSLDAGADRTIRDAVAMNVKKLDTGDAAAQASAREALVSDSSNGSAAYNERYAAAVAAEFTNPALSQAPDARKRLNLAVALARIAASTKSAKLQPAVIAMLDAKQPEAVQLWALKAAGAILPDTLKVDPQKTLLSGIVPAIKDRLTSPMTHEAYEALRVPKEASGPAVIDEVLRLLDARLEVYKTRPETVDEATVDFTGLNYIMGNGIWTDAKIVPDAQKLKTMQTACHLVTLAARAGDAAQAGGAEKEQFQKLIIQVVGSVYVSASVMGAQPLAATASAVINSVKQQNPQLEPAVKPLCPAIQQTPGFQDVKPLQ